jgi:hypothetical protein
MLDQPGDKVKLLLTVGKMCSLHSLRQGLSFRILVF